MFGEGRMVPSKPRKYSIKIFWARESTIGFALNGIIYTGDSVDGPSHKNLAFDIVFELVKPFANTGREIVTDHFFTSHLLAKNLSEMKLTLRNYKIWSKRNSEMCS